MHIQTHSGRGISGKQSILIEGRLSIHLQQQMKMSEEEKEGRGALAKRGTWKCLWWQINK